MNFSDTLTPVGFKLIGRDMDALGPTFSFYFALGRTKTLILKLIQLPLVFRSPLKSFANGSQGVNGCCITHNSSHKPNIGFM